MRTTGVALASWLLTLFSLRADNGVEKHSLQPTPEMDRADIYVCGARNPTAALVLCPGVNGSAEELIKKKVWQDYSEHNNLALVGLSFASDPTALMNGTGYYYASQGSGQVLLNALKKIFGKEVPLLLYGFSGGAHFTSRFTEAHPEKVLSWCAYSAGWWDEPRKAEVTPPGIVACGDQDERYSASLIYFKQGRAAGKPWVWISVPDNAHSPSPLVESFIRDYFLCALSSLHVARSTQEGVWIDIDTETAVDPLSNPPSLTAWLPDEGLLPKWQKINQP
jgi:pimeloyl-ACP methyl ester carboxylesterase